MEETPREDAPQEPGSADGAPGPEAPPPPKPHEALRTAAFALYLPLFGALGYLIIICVQILVSGRPAGLYGILYGAAFAVLLKRALAVYRGDAQGIWKDVAALCVANVFLAILAASFFL